jgi:hypothetical protein
VRRDTRRWRTVIAGAAVFPTPKLSAVSDAFGVARGRRLALRADDMRRVVVPVDLTQSPRSSGSRYGQNRHDFDCIAGKDRKVRMIQEELRRGFV